jgi:hypothetical protein
VRLLWARRKLKIIVSGMVAGDPGQGGAAWAVLQYVLGLLQLGHDVYLIEPVKTEQLAPRGSSLEASKNAVYFLDVARSFGLERRCGLLLQGTTQTVGLSYSDLRTIAQSTTILLNISGMLQQEELIAPIPHRVYLDLDPAFNQLWHATQNIDMRFGSHNRFVTVGNAMGQKECPIPTYGIQWLPTFQPVVLKYWQPAATISIEAFTTVGNWRGYGSIEHDGVFYGQKAHSLRSFIDLPLKTVEKFALALAIDPGETRDLEALKNNRWILLDPATVAATPQQYQKFVSESKAEFGIAKSGYVASRCGWFSDRSACYLACGRPVVAQDTGFSAYLPCGAGLFAFSTPAEALAAIEAINRDYSAQSKAARAIAEEYFDSARVITKLFDALEIG